MSDGVPIVTNIFINDLFTRTRKYITPSLRDLIVEYVLAGLISRQSDRIVLFAIIGRLSLNGHWSLTAWMLCNASDSIG